MAKRYANDHDVRDAKIVKGRVSNLHKLTESLLEKHYLILTRPEMEELEQAKAIFEKILERHKNIQL